MSLKKPITVGSVFTGIGGIDLPFALLGCDILFQIEKDEFCRKVLEKHAQTYWKNATRYSDVFDCGDGRKHELPYVEILQGGFPCQSISNAGKRQGIREGTASGLWFELRRIIGEVRPRLVFLENVAAITSRDGTIVVGDLAALGYDCRWGIISAEDAGAPHERERWWLVGSANSERYGESPAARELRGNGERHDSAGEQTGRDQLHQIERAGEMGDAHRQQPHFAGGNLGNATDQRLAQDSERPIGGGTYQSDRADDARTLEHTDGERREKRHAAASNGGQGQSDGRPVEIKALVHATGAGREGSEREESPESRPANGSGGGSKELSQSSVGRDADGFSGGLVRHQFPAPPGPQFDFEPPRTTPQRTENAVKTLHALGNGALPQCVMPIAFHIVEWFKNRRNEHAANQNHV